MSRNVARLSILLVVLLVVVYLVYQFFFSHHVTLQNLKAQGACLYELSSRYYIISVIIYVVLYFIAIASSLPITAPITMAGGFLFGTFSAVIYSTVAATGGATLAFLLFRSFSKATIGKKYEAQLARFSKGLDEYGAFYLLIVHFMFIVPFFVINALAALANVPLWRFIWTTAVGFLPCAIVYSFAGRQLISIRSFSDIFSWKIIVALILLICIVILPIAFKHLKKFFKK